VPNDPEHVIYVWFEALLNYLTVSRNYTNNIEEVEFVHVIGKDISKFHCYIWPIMLLMNNLYPSKIDIVMHNHWLMNEVS
jgi:methionyl-tRNA synthetase